MLNFIEQQQEFASVIRNPQNKLPEGIEPRRMKIYQELFFNNVNGFLSSTFPVLKTILSDDHWEAMARDFFINHESSTPLFLEISKEFLHYLQHERQPDDRDPAFMLELAHYEWIEMVVSISTADENAPAVDPNGDLLSGRPLLSPVMENLSYQFPVHTIGPDDQPSVAPQEMTHLVVYRNRQDEVHFLQINAVTQQLIEMLKQNPEATGLEIVTAIAEALNHPQPEVVIEGGKALLYDLREKNIVIGTAL